MSSCDPAWGWTCTKIGQRAPQQTPGTWPGDDCSLTKQCSLQSQQCIRKDEKGAFCVDGPVPKWDGDVLGYGREEYAVQPAAEGLPIETTLFCFMAVLPGSAEVQLQHAAESRRGSIYGCDKHKVYQSYPAKFVHEGTWNSFANTDSFIKVWADVFSDGLYLESDWTVKVDPDTVFLPGRLTSHLQRLRPPSNKPIYIKNCAIDFGFLGAIEILSRVAMSNLADGYRTCRRVMPGTSGEDGFIKGCLDALGAGFMTDISILRTPHQLSCTDPSRVAFHPHKSAEDWGSCYDALMR